MASAQNFDTMVSLTELKERKVIVDVDRTCGVCGRKLGAGVAVGVIPNGLVVHHACLPGDASEYHLCPVTGEDFEMQYQAGLMSI